MDGYLVPRIVRALDKVIDLPPLVLSGCLVGHLSSPVVSFIFRAVFDSRSLIVLFRRTSLRGWLVGAIAPCHVTDDSYLLS